MPCTTILVGKKASYNGSTIMARNEDSGAGTFDPKKFIVVTPEEQPKLYKSVISGVEIPLPENPMRYTAMPNAIPAEGIWGEAGFNTLNVAMSETETITSNSRVLGADPLVKEGIGEEDLLTITLPYIKSAREGVLRLGSLLEKYGTYEMNGIGFQDKDEIWWLESIGGHHWIAKRVPDDAYVVGPNQQGIDTFDFVDAFGKQENHLCSDDMIPFIEENHLNLSMSDTKVSEETDFDVRAALGSHSDSDHCYNTPRAWFMERYLNPKTYNWDGPDADFGPEADDIPWSLVPEKKITIEDIKYVLSSYYQGTEYNPYDRRASEQTKGKYRPIGVNRNNFVAITELRCDVPEEISAVEWIAVGSNAFNTAIPFYGNVDVTPEYLSNTTAEVTTENFYWANRIIGALADAQYNKNIVHVERYLLKTMAAGHKLLKDFDTDYINKKASGNIDAAEAPKYLEECNQKLADMAKAATGELLDKVLYTTSMQMKNAFSRDDS